MSGMHPSQFEDMTTDEIDRDDRLGECSLTQIAARLEAEVEVRDKQAAANKDFLERAEIAMTLSRDANANVHILQDELVRRNEEGY